ncbi:MAG: TonB-dependent receptor [Gammaproteobacteria bacterium]|nr:TonB-dependent receptor [Gammaproteobacteria bacterium]
MKNHLTYCFLIVFVSFYQFFTPLLADDLKAQKDNPIEFVTVIGSRKNAFDEAGSADYISVEDLEEFLYTDPMRVLRQAPGVYVQEEEGFGLRPNIGIRGSGADRSSRITLLEDGVLIAPAPYAAPSAYYFPTQQRMSAVEVLKGPAAIRVGSRTVGGAINFVSTPIPEANQGNITALLGTDATNQLLARYGGQSGKFGYLLEFTNNGSDGFKSIPNIKADAHSFDLQDYLAKFSYNFESTQGASNHIELKLSKTEQDADSSYLGLTESDFSIDPFQRYAASQLDNIKTDHEQIQVNYVFTPAAADWQLGVSVYDNQFRRNWYKLQTTATASLAAILDDPDMFAVEYGWLNGAINSPDDALEIRANKREYYGRGIQSEINWETYFGTTGVVWNAGVRFHKDQEDRFQDQDKFKIENGIMQMTTDAAPGSQTNRVSNAEVFAAFVEADIDIGKWSFKPGVRFESIDLMRNDYAKTDPARVSGPSRVRENSIDVLIPGIGITYALSDNLLLLAGVHKGFNPPAPGSASEEEESLNIEAGLRFDGDESYLEAIAFNNDYKNIVGTVTASTGGDGNIGDQFDGGEATVNGLELSLGRDIAISNGLIMPLNLSHTWTSTFEFDNSFSSGFGPWGEVIAGDEMPYIPAQQFQASIGLEGIKWSAKLLANYTGERRTRAGQDNIDILDSYLVWDMSADYQVKENLRLFTRLENAFDKNYIAAARPIGLRPGKPRSFVMGVNYQF